MKEKRNEKRKKKCENELLFNVFDVITDAKLESHRSRIRPRWSFCLSCFHNERMYAFEHLILNTFSPTSIDRSFRVSNRSFVDLILPLIVTLRTSDRLLTQVPFRSISIQGNAFGLGKIHRCRTEFAFY